MLTSAHADLLNAPLIIFPSVAPAHSCALPPPACCVCTASSSIAASSALFGWLVTRRSCFARDTGSWEGRWAISSVGPQRNAGLVSMGEQGAPSMSCGFARLCPPLYFCCCCSCCCRCCWEEGGEGGAGGRGGAKEGGFDECDEGGGAGSDGGGGGWGT